MNDRDQLPIEGYDHLTAGDLQHRIHSLEPEQVQRLLDHEQQNANRLPIVELLAARMDQLAAGAIPSGGTPHETPGEQPGPTGGSKVDPSTAAESTSPLRHGVAGQTPKRGRS